MSFEPPEVGQFFHGSYRVRCCEEDWGGSHYHCGQCGEVTGMYGHRVTLKAGVAWAEAIAEGLGVSLPFDGFTCAPDLQPAPSLMAVCGPFDGPAPWEQTS